MVERIHTIDRCIYRNDRLTRGGGVAILVRSDIYRELIQSITDLEILKIKIHISNKNLYLVVVYFPPPIEDDFSYKLDLEIEDIFQHTNFNDYFVVCGDFNMPDYNPDFLDALSNNSRLLNNVFCFYNLRQRCLFPTRKENFLDLCYTNFETQVMNIRNIFVSDHISFEFMIPINKCDSYDFERLVLKFHQAEWSEIKSYLEKQSIDYNNVHPNDATVKLLRITDNAILLFVPFTKYRDSSFPK